MTAPPPAAGSDLTVESLIEQTESQVGDEATPTQFLATLLATTARRLRCDRLALHEVRAVQPNQSPEVERLLAFGAEESNADGERVMALLRTVAAGEVRVESLKPDERPDRLLRDDANPPGDDWSYCVIGNGVVPGVLMAIEVIGQNVDDQLPLLTAIGDVAADLYRRILLTKLVAGRSENRRLLAVVSELHGKLDRRATIASFVTDGPAVMACDTAAVLTYRFGRGWQTVATTAVNDPHPRAAEVRRLGEATARAVAEARSIPADDLSGDQSGAIPVVRTRTDADTGQIEETFVPVAPATGWRRPTTVAVLRRLIVPEDTSASDRDALSSASSTDAKAVVAGNDAIVCSAFAASLANCDEAFRRGLIGRSRSAAGRMLGLGPLLTLGAFVALASWLWFGKLPLRVDATGQLVPLKRTVTFAPNDGTVREVFVRRDESVQTEQRLLAIENADLLMARQTLAGELAAVNSQLAALLATRREWPREAVARNAADVAQLEVEAETLTQRLKLATTQIDSLTVVAPHEGVVSRSEPMAELAGRPVRRGQALCAVIDETGGWEVRLAIPEEEVRHVPALAGDQAVTVRYYFESSPDQLWRHPLDSLGHVVKIDANGRLIVEGIVSPDVEAALTHRQGAGVVAVVECGPRRAGWVLTRRLVEFLRRRFWFE